MLLFSSLEERFGPSLGCRKKNNFGRNKLLPTNIHDY